MTYIRPMTIMDCVFIYTCGCLFLFIFVYFSYHSNKALIELQKKSILVGDNSRVEMRRLLFQKGTLTDEHGKSADDGIYYLTVVDKEPEK